MKLLHYFISGGIVAAWALYMAVLWWATRVRSEVDHATAEVVDAEPVTISQLVDRSDRRALGSGARK